MPSSSRRGVAHRDSDGAVVEHLEVVGPVADPDRRRVVDPQVPDHRLDRGGLVDARLTQLAR